MIARGRKVIRAPRFQLPRVHEGRAQPRGHLADGVVAPLRGSFGLIPRRAKVQTSRDRKTDNRNQPKHA